MNRPSPSARSVPDLPALRLAAALAAVAALVAGCGGGSSSSAFVARGDRICSATRARARAISQPPASAGATAQAAYLHQVVPVARSEIDQLQALPASKDEAAKRNAYLRAQLEQIAKVQQATGALASADSNGAQAGFQAALGLAPRIQALAKQAGFRVCQAEFS